MFHFLQFVIPEGGFLQGNYFGYGPGVPFGDTWNLVAGTFTLDSTGQSTPAGQQLFVYCIDPTTSSVRPLHAFSYNGPFVSLPNGQQQAFGPNDSALPPTLQTLGTVVLQYHAAYFYNGPRQAPIRDLQHALQDPTQWIGKDDGRFTIEVSSAYTLNMPAWNQMLYVLGGALLSWGALSVVV